MTTAVCVDPQHVGRVWPRVEGFIREAIERVGISNFNDVVDDLVHGNSLLWLGWSEEENQIVSAGVTELTGEVCTLVAYGGRREDHLLAAIENYARDEGCTTMRLLGREGWARVLKPHGYRQPYIVLERQL